MLQRRPRRNPVGPGEWIDMLAPLVTLFLLVRRGVPMASSGSAGYLVSLRNCLLRAAVSGCAFTQEAACGLPLRRVMHNSE